MSTPGPSPSSADGLVQRVVKYFRGVVRRTREEAEQEKQKAQEAALAHAAALRRPSGWAGHWSARYGEVLARTLHVDPPFDRPQRELLAAVPKPLHEALDPAASTAEPIDRDGNLVAWRFSRSVLFDLFGPVGLVVGALALAALGFATTLPRLGLPPLTEQVQLPQPEKEDLRQQQAPPPPPGPARR